MVFIDLHTKKEVERPSCALSLAIGNFDGVHIGHVALIEKAKELAANIGAASGVWSFDTPPSDILLGRGAVPQLSDLEDKISIFASLGLDYAVFGSFEELRDLSPERFMDEILYKECTCRAIVCGFNFHFGACGAGDAAMLSRYFAEKGGISAVIPAVKYGDDVVSSTLIRKMLEGGNVELARTLLGRPYFIKAPVLHGKKLGRTIGIPTINQKFPCGRAMVGVGIYACMCEFDGEAHYGVVNVGHRPTVEDAGELNLETYIIDFDREIYGKDVKLSFYIRLRDEKRFTSLDELSSAVLDNAESAKEYFENLNKGGTDR